MSNLVFPSSLPGITIGVKRRPIYATTVQTAKSGKELRASWQSYPRYRYVLNFEFVRSDATNQEFQTLMGLFARTMGAWDSFLLTDPDDSTVTLMPFGRGHGSTLAFQLQRSLVPSAQLPADASKTFWPGVGDGFEPVFDLNGTPTIYRTDWQGTQQLYSTARTNLALQSEDFTSALWVKTNTTITANAWTLPNGSATGDNLVETAATGSHQMMEIFSSVAGQAFTASIYGKAGPRRYLRFALNDGSSFALAIFDLLTGTIVSTGAGTASIVSMGSGVYRCIITGTGTATGTGNGTIYVQISNDGVGASYVGDGTSYLSLGGMQLEKSSVATSYILTTTAAVSVTDYTLSSTGLVTLATAPVNGVMLAWSGSYYRRVRFEEDELDLERLFYQIWEAKTVALKSVK